LRLVILKHLDDANVLAKLGLTSLLLKTKEISRFLVEAEKLYLLLPKHPRVIYFYALANLQQGQTAKARNLLETLLKYRPQDSAATMLLARTYYDEKRFELADVTISKFTKRYPNQQDALKLQGAIKLKIQDYGKAVSILSRLVTEETTDFGLLSMLGTALVLNEESDLGTQYLERAAKLSPEDPIVHTELALGLMAQGKYQLAQASLEEAVNLDDDLVYSEVLLIFSSIRTGNLSKAIEVAQKLQIKKPDIQLLTFFGSQHFVGG